VEIFVYVGGFKQHKIVKRGKGWVLGAASNEVNGSHPYICSSEYTILSQGGKIPDTPRDDWAMEYTKESRRLPDWGKGRDVSYSLGVTEKKPIAPGTFTAIWMAE